MGADYSNWHCICHAFMYLIDMDKKFLFKIIAAKVVFLIVVAVLVWAMWPSPR